MFKDLNKQTRSTVKEGIDLTALSFVKLHEFVGKTILVDGFFFTNGDYGKQIVVVGNGYKINLPARYVEAFEQIQASDEMLDAMFNGHMALTNIRSIKTKQGYTTVFDFADC